MGPYLNMDDINTSSSYRPTVSVQQTKTEWMDEVINIYDSSDCETSMSQYSSQEIYDDDPHSYIQKTDDYSRVELIRLDADEDEIVKEEFYLNEKYDNVEIDEVFYTDSQTIVNDDVHPSINPKIGTDGSTVLQKTISMEEGANEIMNAADQLLKSYDFECENRLNEAAMFPNPQYASNESLHSMILIEESSSEVDSDVMIDLVSDNEEIDPKIVYVIQSSDNEVAPKEQPPQEQKQERKAVKIRKMRKKKQKSARGSKGTKKHKCDLCQYSTSNKSHFERHLLTHSAKKRLHKCKICMKRYLRSQTLVAHMKLHARDATVFRCSNCRREFPREKPCKSHENKCKKGLRMYECYVCKEIVHNKNHLLKHIRAHTGTMIRCQKCRKQFASQLGLTHHMKKHDELFAFQCKICHQVFSHRNKWKMHEKRCKLKQYKCDICNRDFVNKNHFVYHMQKHAGHTIKCPKCTRQFRSAIGYKSHRC